MRGHHFSEPPKKNNDDRIILNSLLKNADVVICSGGSFSLDALCFDKPVINIGFDGGLNLPKEASMLSRFRIDHYAKLLNYKGIYLVKNYQELDRAVKESLAKPDKLMGNIKKIKEKYLKPLDGRASERFFEIIKNA